MTKIKQNWDHLVDRDGLYGIDIAQGIYPGSPNNPGIKGNKGEAGQTIVGPKGAKGRPGANGSDGAKGIQGRKGNTGQKGVKGVKGVVGGNGIDGDKGQKGRTGNTGPKGDRGEAGIKGAPGVDGSKGDGGQKGDQGQGIVLKAVVPTEGDLPPTGNTPGDLYIVSETGDGYVWTDDGQWNNVGPIPVGPKGIKGDFGDTGDKGLKGEKGTEGSVGNTGEKGATGADGIKGEKGVKGEKGQKGVKGEKGQTGQKGEIGVGQKGVKGAPGVDGTDGAKGDDGQKGTKGTEVDLNNYFTKGEILTLIDPLGPPEEAFDVDSYSYANSKINAGNIDFLDSSEDAAIYNKGIVTISPAVTVSNCPLEASNITVVNYILNDPGGLRGSEYDLVQWVMNGGQNAATSEGEAYFRYVKPASSIFSPWKQATFNPAAYYDRTEVDALVAAASGSTYELSTQANGDDAQLILTNEKDSSTDVVTISGEGGIGVSVAGATITLDGSGVSGTLLFSGSITPPTDPATLEPNPVAGQYFIYNADGTAWNGEAVQQGDWAIFNGDSNAWQNLNYVSLDPGVTAVTVSGGLLTLGGTDAEPDISLDPADVVVPADLADYATIEDLGSFNDGLTLNNLSDVSVNVNELSGPAALNTKVTGAPGNGEYSVDTATNTLTFAKTGSAGGDTAPVFNAIVIDETLCRVQNNADPGTGVASYVTAKVDNGSSYSFTFASPAIVAFLDANNVPIRITPISYDIGDGDILQWDNSTKTWVNADGAPNTTELAQDFLLRDGSNSFTGQSLNLNVPDTSNRFNLNVNTDSGIALTRNNSYMLRATPSNVAVASNFSLNNNSKINFNGGNGVKLNMPASNWGSLSNNDNHQIEWGVNGVKLHVDIAMNATGTRNRITGLADPTDDQDAATRKYVTDQINGLNLSDYARLTGTNTFTQNNTFNGSNVSLGGSTTCVWNGNNETTIQKNAGSSAVLRVLIGANAGNKFRVANGNRGVLEVAGDHSVTVSDNWNTALKNGSETRETALVTKGYVDSVAGGNYTLPRASSSVLGGVKVGTTSGTYVSCTKMSGDHIGVIEATNTTRGVTYKGQACVTGSSTPSSGSYKQGQLIFSTGSNSLYIHT